jgi:hypothetical protein
MCPACITTAAMVVASATSTAGLTALIVRKLRGHSNAKKTHVRNVKAARRYLEDIGLLQRTEVPQWVLNRYGQKMTINLQWEASAPRTSPPSLAGELPPPPRSQRRNYHPLIHTQNSLREIHTRNPPPAGPLGFYAPSFTRHGKPCARV